MRISINREQKGINEKLVCVVLLTKIVTANNQRIVSGILTGIDIGVMISGAVIRPAQIGMK